MPGIYLHIPFCKKACHYCNFHFSTSTKQLPEMVEAIVREMELRRDYVSGDIETIYFGGGTPSLLNEHQLATILEALRKHFVVVQDAEITLEANPDDISAEALSGWKKLGINRLSIGVQSFSEEDLRWMNRAHKATQSVAAIALAKEHGFENITIDLIYGVPGLDDAQWKKNVDTALALGIPHLSCYALTVEPKTALEKMIAQHKTTDVDTDQQARQFSLLTEWLIAAGYEHYEISNFAKPGFRSRHNSSYWRGAHYLGLGPSAHSFNGVSRQWNIANNAAYIANIQTGALIFESETLTDSQRLNEYIMTSLRMMEGISLAEIEENWGREKRESILQDTQKHIGRGHVIHNNNRLQLTAAGKFLADGIASDLFDG